MNITIDDLGPCKKLLRIDVEAASVDAEFDKMIKEFRRQARIPGFRKGKAPREALLRAYKTDIEKEVKKNLLSNAYRDALKEQKLSVIGYPEIEEIQFAEGQDFQFAATVEISPDFTLPDYKKIPVKVEKRSVTDEDMDRALLALQEQRGTYADVDRPVKNGDFAVVDYTGTCEGKPISETAPSAQSLSEKKDFWIQVKEGSFLPGFSEQLVDAKIGDEKTVTVTFPDNFAAKELCGKEGVFQVKIKKLKERSLPELNDEFAQSYEAENMEKLRDGVRNDLENELKQTKARSIRNQIIQALTGKLDFDLPESVLEQETKNTVYDLVKENQQRGVSQAAIEQKKDEIYVFANNSAKEKVKTGFILRKIAEEEKIKVSQEELNQRVLQLAYSYQIPVKKFVKELQQRNGVHEVHDQVLIGKTLDFLELNAEVEEVLPEKAPAGGA